jgi:signal transduction histidine kinase
MKLAAALAMPLFALAVVTALEVAQSTREADEVRSEANLAKASTGHQGLITTLQDERSWASVELVGQQATYTLEIEGYDGTRAATDAAVAAFEAELAGEERAVREAFRPALDSLSELENVRADIDAFSGPKDLTNIDTANEIYGRYSALIQPFLRANSLVVSAIDDPELREGASLVDLATRQVEAQAELTRLTVVGVTLGGGVDTSREITGISQSRSIFDQNNRDILSIGEPYAALVDELYPEEVVGRLLEQVDSAIATGAGDVTAILEGISLPPDEGYGGMVDRLADDLVVRADDLRQDAEARQRWYIVLAVATLAAALAITWWVSRSITRPLRSLTRQATAMADHRLPEAVLDILDTPLGEDVDVPQVEPVGVATRDEVSDVAEALNTVQDTALDLAVEQAVLRRNIADSFVNLGRRNQNLLGRQLDFITELETNETDPDTLGNLFRLDHLATRMRRNAESLLVLAGIEPPRKWAAPVRLTDVIRAALGEVEDYQRVTVRGVEPATVVGVAAADLAHLLAELIENALVFSPPDQNVDIRGRNRPEGYTLAIIDSGLGMTAADVEAANRRLAGAESFTIAPSKYLGHYVAGNLASRRGIGVRLDNSPGNGVTATVDIPPALLTTEAVTSAPVTPPQGMRPAGVALRGRAPALAPPPPQEPLPVPSAAARSVFDDAVAAEFEPPAWLTEPPPHQPSRTASGLVKRGPRAGDGDGARATAAPAAAHAGPNEDLLASLARLAGTTRGGEQAAPPLGFPPPPGGGPRGNRFRPREPEAMGFEPETHDPARGPVKPMTSESPPLTRRVRGAQLPLTEPRTVRRAPVGGPSGAPPPAFAPRRAAAPAGEMRRSPDDVYGFLTSFTAGVQRGLDETNSHERRGGDR